MLPSGPGGVRKTLLRRTQFSTPPHASQSLQQGRAAHEGFSPAIADRGRQGTATSPPSTTSFCNQSIRMRATDPLARALAGPHATWRRGWDSNPRYPYEVHTLSRRADSTNSRTSPTCLKRSLPPGCPGFGRYGHRDTGGGRGIRTPEEPCGPLIDFESIAFVHSAIPPLQPTR